MILLLDACSSKIYFQETHYCNDTLYLNEAPRTITGKVYYLTESGSPSGYESFKNGVSDGAFEEWGYDKQVIHSGFNSPIDLKNSLSNLQQKYTMASLSEMYEGEFLINIITLIKKDGSHYEDSINILKPVFLNGIEKEMKKKLIKIDTIIIEYPKSSIDCK
jgi:hypothetical protein